MAAAHLQQGHSRQVIQGVAENVQQMAQGLATNAKQMAKGFAQSSRQVAEIYKENVAQRKNQTDEWTKLSGKLEEYLLLTVAAARVQAVHLISI